MPLPDYAALHPGYKEEKEAERRQTCIPTSASTDAARVQRDALACRRSTTALATANQRRSSAPDALPGTWLSAGVIRRPLSQSSD